MSHSEVTVIIPTLNEEKTIQLLLAKLVTLYPDIAVIVVDDVSADNTISIVEQFISAHAQTHARDSLRLLVRKDAPVRGITASVIDALALVHTPYVAVMDGDLQHPPEVIDRIIRRLKLGADVVCASRSTTVVLQPFHRIAVTWISTWIARLALRLRGFAVSDPMSGFFAAKTELLQQTISRAEHRFEPAGYKVMFDLLRCMEKPLLLDEVKYAFGLRPHGGSKLRPIHAFYFLRSVLK